MRLVLDIGRWDTFSAVELCELVVSYNVRIMRASPHPLHLYLLRARYVADPPSEPWMSIDVLARRRQGDCEDLAAALAAGLRVYGHDAVLPGGPLDRSDIDYDTARVVLADYGDDQYHAIVRCNTFDGQPVDEDPSAFLGMRGGHVDERVLNFETYLRRAA